MSGTYSTSGTYTLTSIPLDVVTAIAQPATPTPIAVTFDLVGAAGAFDITSDTGATTTVRQAVTVLNTLNLTADGGTLIVGKRLIGLDTITGTIEDGGTLSSALPVAGSITFGAGGGTDLLTAKGTGAVTGGDYVGFLGAEDVIDDEALRIKNFTNYSISGTGGTQTITVTAGTNSYTFTTIGTSLADGTYTSLTAGPLNLVDDGNGGVSIAAVCFLRGTHIETDRGERPIEQLAVGDLVATRTGGVARFEPIRWVGRRRMDVRHAQDVLEAYPVRIRADAFGPGAPHRDLLVTPEHCLHVDGRLIPARMLVNGRSILVDTTMRQYEYLHLELDGHAILLAEGLEAESYLDTGNRGNFVNAEAPSLRPDFAVSPAHRSWAAHAAAPLAVDRATVEPVWHRLDARAEAMGLAAPAGLARVDSPELRLVAADGLELRPLMIEDGRVGFVVPQGTGALRIVSRASRPADVIGPFVDDRRRLGVKLGAILVADRDRAANRSHLSEAPLAGWHAMEPGDVGRWTDGNATLPVDLSRIGGPVLLEIELLSAGPYLVAPAPRAADARAA